MNAGPGYVKGRLRTRTRAERRVSRRKQAVGTGAAPEPHFACGGGPTRHSDERSRSFLRADLIASLRRARRCHSEVGSSCTELVADNDISTLSRQTFSEIGLSARIDAAAPAQLLHRRPIIADDYAQSSSE